jgi:hypothetical protein
MALTSNEKQVVSPNSLIAVYDESGHRSSEPGQILGDDFSIAAVIFNGRRAFANLKQLDTNLQKITGRTDYKYRQIRQSTKARSEIIRTLKHQSGLIRIQAFYAEGGAFVRESERALSAVINMKSGDNAIANAKDKLDEINKNPGRVSLRDAIVNSIPAAAHWASTRNQVVDMFFDQRSDMPEFSRYLTDYVEVFKNSPPMFQIGKNLRWHAECVPELEPISRIADIFAGDIRHTFRRHGLHIWDQLEDDGFVGRHDEIMQKSIYRNELDLPPPLTKVGHITDTIWDDNPLEASTATTMFAAYSDFLIKRALSLFSPDGIGCHIMRSKEGFHVIQNPD